MCILLGEYPGSIEKLIKMPVGGFLIITTLVNVTSTNTIPLVTTRDR